MLTVHKYPVPLTDDFSIQMPAGAQVLSFQVQYGEMQLWALVNPSASSTPRHFRLAGTGHPIEEAVSRLRFIGTVQLRGGSLIFHLFEIVPLAEPAS